MNHFVRLIVVIACLVCSAGAVSADSKSKPSPAKAKVAERSSESAASLLDTAIAELERGELANALSLARRAAALSPANYKAHCYVGFVLFKMNEFDNAHAAVQEALRFAPVDARADLQKLAQAVKAARASSQAAALAEAAQAEGLNGKAAAMWKQAWEAGFQHPDHGFAAAQIYSTSLAQPVAAAQIMREIVAKSTDTAATDKAARMLEQLAPQLSTIAASQFEAAQRAEGAARMQLLRETLDADPNFMPAYEMRALFAAETGDAAALKEVLRDMSRRNKLDLSLLKRAEFAKVMKDPGMALWMDDLVGTVAAKKLMDELAGQEGTRSLRVRYDRDQQEYQGKLASYEQQLAEHQKYVPCLEDAQTRQHSCEAALPRLKRGIFGMGGNEAVREAMRGACVRQSKELVAQCASSYPPEPPEPPEAPAAPGS